MITRTYSSTSYPAPSAQCATLSYQTYCYVSADSAAFFSPDHFRRGITRSVSCYALFKWWLPLSQHPECQCDATSFNPLRTLLGALTGGVGCFPFDDGAYPPPSDSRSNVGGIRSSAGFGIPVGTLGQSVALPPLRYASRLALKLFRREPAITGFDWSFAPIHSSSKPFSTGTGSALRPVLPGVQPGHG
jgi:hypothetical protein